MYAPFKAMRILLIRSAVLFEVQQQADEEIQRGENAPDMGSADTFCSLEHQYSGFK